jgi:hypothetical protein
MQIMREKKTTICYRKKYLCTGKYEIYAGFKVMPKLQRTNIIMHVGCRYEILKKNIANIFPSPFIALNGFRAITNWFCQAKETSVC